MREAKAGEEFSPHVSKHDPSPGPAIGRATLSHKVRGKKETVSFQ